MNSYFFLRHGMRAANLKRQWDQDSPLALNRGGSMGTLSQWTPQELAETLRTKPGSKVTALGCLTQLSNDFSCPQLAISVDTVEQVGRRFWTTKVAVSPDTAVVSPGSAMVSPGSAAVSPGLAAFSPGFAAVSPGSDMVLWMRER